MKVRAGRRPRIPSIRVPGSLVYPPIALIATGYIAPVKAPAIPVSGRFRRQLYPSDGLVRCTHGNAHRMTELARIGRADALNDLPNARKKKIETVVTLLLQTLVGRIGNPPYLPARAVSARRPQCPELARRRSAAAAVDPRPVPRHDADDENPLLCYDRVEIQIFGTEE